MSIKRADRSQPESDQLTIWTLLDRVSADPLEANIIDLSNWIGSLDLESAGDALVTWGVSFRDRAIQLLNEWQLKSHIPHFNFYDMYWSRRLDSLTILPIVTH